MSSPGSGSRIGLATSGNIEQLLHVIYLYGPGDETDEEGRTLFHYCVDLMAWNVVEYLLQVGVPVDIRDGNFCTSLHHACKKPSYDTVVSQLHYFCLIPKSTSLPDFPHVYLLRRGANPREVDGGGSTPLHFAAFSGNIEVVKVLLQVGVDINKKCKLGWSPLHYAAERGHDAVVDLLLHHGATIDAGKTYRNGRIELSAVDMAQSLVIRNKLEVNMLSSMMDGFSL